MKRPAAPQLLAISLAILFALGAHSSAATPTMKEVESIVRAHFKTLKDYRDGDLIARSEVTKALALVDTAGWRVPDDSELTKKVLADDDFMITALRTEAGRKFMRQVAKISRGYDRVDRLARLPQGQAKVNELVKTPGGSKMIEYMATASGGRELGKMLSSDRGGKDFNQATGKIYTAEGLLAALRKRYERFP